jgi:hypothetical protein
MRSSLRPIEVHQYSDESTDNPNILFKKGMASICDRMLKMKNTRAIEPLELSYELVAFIERHNSDF